MGVDQYCEFVLGGATATVLSDPRLPVLMSHSVMGGPMPREREVPIRVQLQQYRSSTKVPPEVRLLKLQTNQPRRTANPSSSTRPTATRAMAAEGKLFAKGIGRSTMTASGKLTRPIARLASADPTNMGSLG